MKKQIMQSWSRCERVWMKWMVVWLTTIWLTLSFILPFFLTWQSHLFFGSCFLACLLFSFSGANHDMDNSGVFILEREIVETRSIYWWMVDDANSQCRNFANGGGRVRDLNNKSIKIFSLGSHNLTILNEIVRNIWIKLCNNVLIWLS